MCRVELPKLKRSRSIDRHHSSNFNREYLIQKSVNAAVSKEQQDENHRALEATKRRIRGGKEAMK